MPNFSQIQAASDGSHGVRLIYAFDLLQLESHHIASLPLIERKALLKPVIAGIPGLQFNEATPSNPSSHACFRISSPSPKPLGAGLECA